MKLPADQLIPVFCADIDVSIIEDYGIEIRSIDELVRLIEQALRSQRISFSLDRNAITGLTTKPIDVILVDNTQGGQKIIAIIRSALQSANLDWIEPYSEDSTEFRFILPKVNIFKS